MKEPKPGKPLDVRPIGISTSFFRLTDKCAVKNCEDAVIRNAVGPFQCVGLRQGTKIGTLVCDVQCELIKKVPGEVIYTEDVKNAFNSVNRQANVQDVLLKLPDLAYHYINLYARPTIIDYGSRHRIYMTSGYIQGLTSSGLFYNMTKWSVQSAAKAQMLTRHSEFKISSCWEYMDDGNRTMQLKYVPDWIRCQIASHSVSTRLLFVNLYRKF